MAFSPRIGIDVFRAEVGLMRNITHGEFLPVRACFEGVIIYSPKCVLIRHGCNAL